MIRMLLIGYCCGIRSERQLCYEVTMNLAYRWFCKLSINDKVPDHSTFSKNRHGRFREAEVFRFVFEQVLQRCMDEGLIGGEGFAVDASVVKADASRQKHHEDDDDDWGDGSRAINEYLDALKEDGSSIPADRKKVSQTDPLAQWTAAPGGPAYYAYSTNYLVDTQAGIIVDVEATPALRTPEVWSTKTMIERVKDRFGLETKKLIGDTAYGTAEFLNWMVNEAKIEPHVPVWERGEGEDDRFGRSDFAYNEETDSYTCPNDKELLKSRRNFKKPRPIPKSDFIKYRASKMDCGPCPLKEQCCPKSAAKKLLRSIYEKERDVAREVAKTPAYRKTRRQRKQVEMLFAHMKRILKMDRLRLRGLSGARDDIYFRGLCDVPGFHDEVAGEAERLASLRNDGYRILRVAERFERARMSDEYRGIYHWLCSDTHNSLRGMSLRHIEYIDDQTYEIHILKDEPVDAQLPIMSALLGYLIESSKLIHTRFGKGQDAVKDIEAKVSAIGETH